MHCFGALFVPSILLLYVHYYYFPWFHDHMWHPGIIILQQSAPLLGQLPACFRFVSTTVKVPLPRLGAPGWNFDVWWWIWKHRIKRPIRLETTYIRIYLKKSCEKHCHLDFDDELERDFRVSVGLYYLHPNQWLLMSSPYNLKDRFMIFTNHFYHFTMPFASCSLDRER